MEQRRTASFPPNTQKVLPSSSVAQPQQSCIDAAEYGPHAPSMMYVYPPPSVGPPFVPVNVAPQQQCLTQAVPQPDNFGFYLGYPVSLPGSISAPYPCNTWPPAVFSVEQQSVVIQTTVSVHPVASNFLPTAKEPADHLKQEVPEEVVGKAQDRRAMSSPERPSEEKKKKKNKKSKKRKTKDGADKKDQSAENITLADHVVTLDDYKVDFMKDDDDFDPDSVRVPQSTRVIALATEAEKFLLKKANTTSESVHEDFLNRVLLPMRADRRGQSESRRAPTPPMHSNCGCGKDDESEEESSEDDKEDSPSDVPNQNPTEDELSGMNDKQRNLVYLQREIERKRNHPNGVHPDICYNESGMSNDGPLCRCSIAAKTKGMRHGYYPGEEFVEYCDPNTSNKHRLYHYLLKISPPPSDRQISRTVVMTNTEEFEFEGFSLLSHTPLPEYFPRMPASRWSNEYEFTLIEEALPDECYTVASLDMLCDTIFREIFEMHDFHLRAKNVDDGCPLFHVMPRFISFREQKASILSMRAVMAFFIMRYSQSLCDDSETRRLLALNDEEFCKAATRLKQNIVVRTDKKPSSIRVDDLSRDTSTGEIFIVHNTIKPQVYTTAYNPRLQNLERKYNKMKHLSIVNREKAYDEEMETLRQEIAVMKADGKAIRVARVLIPVQGYHLTGLFPDSIAHVLMLIISVHHTRYQFSLAELEKHLKVKFKNRALLDLAMTHPSFKNNHGTNADHAKNLLTNCGYRRRYTSDERHDRKRGIHNLLNIMSKQSTSKASPVPHNERLEYMGDAVVEMLVTNRLFFMLRHHNEGGLATYRSTLVQNRNLASLAKVLRLDEWIQYAHGADLCHEADFRHALANAFEALMAAVFFDSGIDSCDSIFSFAMFGAEPELRDIWDNVAEHELKVEFPGGDRHLISEVPSLARLAEFEEMIGVQFKHIRILAKAFTRRNIPFNDLTKGNNQRLEWLGDTVLQLIVSDYLYRHFPYHHEGHLSLLRTSIVSNKTQSLICDDLALTNYLIRPPNPSKETELRIKDKADIVEALIGALFVDKGLVVCRTFVRMCFLPRLSHFIETNRWNDPKSELQQCVLTLRRADSKEPDIPEYRTLKVEGPTNTRVYEVAVYFRKQRLAVGVGGNIHAAQMDAAEKALRKKHELFPTLSKEQWEPSKKRRRERNSPPPRVKTYDKQTHKPPIGANGAPIPPLFMRTLTAPPPMPPSNFLAMPPFSYPHMFPPPGFPPMHSNGSGPPPLLNFHAGAGPSFHPGPSGRPQ